MDDLLLGAVGRFGGVPVFRSSFVRRDRALLIPGVGAPRGVVLGTRVPTEQELWVDELRDIVRAGVAAAHPWLRLPERRS